MTGPDHDFVPTDPMLVDRGPLLADDPYIF